MSVSLRRRLLLSLAVTLGVAWSASALLSYLDARRRIGEMLDAHLVQAATLILSLGTPADGAPHAAPHWGAAHEGHALLYQVWGADGRLLARSEGAPDAPLSAQAEGAGRVERDGQRWSVYGARAPDGRRVLVAEHAHFREELAAGVARHLLWPAVAALPVLAALTWLAVGWALRPLGALARELGGRGPDALHPLGVRHGPVEVRPLVAALDTLFGRVAAAVEGERRFTADAAHELRTPLAAVRTNVEVALGARDAQEREAALAHAREATERATRLVAQLLVLARLDARRAPPELAPVDVAQLVARKVGEAAQLAAERGVGLGLAEPAEGRALASAELLDVLVRNLVDNALRYTPRGGHVEVHVRPEGGRVRVEVVDDGPGLPAAERARVLERFYRARQTDAEGSGLGLSIAARIAELHGAELVLADGPGGRGLRVRLALRSA